MKKITFYTRKLIGGRPCAVLVEGYADGVFSYYKDEYGRWFAVIPTVGLSPIKTLFASHFTRKSAAEAAYSVLEDVNSWLAEHGDAERAYFNALISKIDA